MNISRAISAAILSAFLGTRTRNKGKGKGKYLHLYLNLEHHEIFSQVVSKAGCAERVLLMM